MNIIKKIDAWALKEPTRQVYEYLDKTYTYGELKQQSDALANYLQQLALPQQTPIMVYGGQSFEMLVAFLGIVKANHAYIPIDMSSPAERVKVISEIAKPSLCIAVEQLADNLITCDILDQTKLQSILSQQVPTPIESKAVFDDNFYIIFTSGTTGVPKGVQITHRNLASFCEWMLSDFALPEKVTCLAQPPYSFDLSVMNLYPTLLLGGKLVALPKMITDDFKQLFEKLPTLGIQEWVSTPSFIDLCMLDPKFKAENLPELNYFLFCGEELTHATATKLQTRFPKAKIYNTYGPTETTVAVTAVEITPDILAKYPRLPIGQAKKDTTIILLDEDNQPLLDKQAQGEIAIIGPSVSKGYLNNPDKTTAAFKQLNGQWVYKTGDLGEFDEAGQLLYKGRLDFQVKLHGFRIELEDVDHHLNEVSLIEQAITVPKYDQNHKVSQLVAYVVPKETTTLSQLELTKKIKAELTESMMFYMMPQRFIYVDSLPLTQNGKIDRKSLTAEVNQ